MNIYIQNVKSLYKKVILKICQELQEKQESN
jgi:hypothetical protein